MSRNKLYVFIVLACIAGYTWLGFSYYQSVVSNNTFGVCMIKHITDIPCPSCGSTRSALAFLGGNFTESILLNPLGILILSIMTTFPLWIGYDIIKHKDTFYRAYQKIEMHFSKKAIAIPAILLVIINWIWNIHKGL